MPCSHVIESHSNPVGHPYILLEYMENVRTRMLSSSWSKLRHDPVRRENLFRDLSKVMLALAQHPQPRVGSFTIDDQGLISLTNRPLTVEIHKLENENISSEITRDFTFTSSDAYFNDVLRCQDLRIRHRRNAVHDEVDAKAQMAALAGMRCVLPDYIYRDRRQGPFTLMLTDLHQSNILVDEDWHIQCVLIWSGRVHCLSRCYSLHIG